MASFLLLAHLIFARMALFVTERAPLILFALIVVLVWFQYRRVAAVERELYGLPKNRPLHQVGEAVVHGVVGGVLVSLLAAFAGVILVEVPGAPAPLALLLWPVALLLSLLHPRYICFAYATTVLGLSYLLFGWPRVDIPSLVGLVAILHLVEAFLIWLGGAACATPVVLNGRDRQPMAGFQLQRYWPVPLVLPMTGVPWDIQAANVGSWWPLVSPDPALVAGAGSLAVGLFPLVVAMGYADLAVTMPPEQRARRSAGSLAVYSLVLFALAILAGHLRAFLWVAALFSAVGHEFLILRGARAELAGVPYLEPPRRGVGVLDVIPGSPAALAGLHSGSVVLQVADREVNSREQLHEAIVKAPAYFRLVYKNGWQLEAKRLPRPDDGLFGFGAILLPEPGDAPVVRRRI